MENIAGILFALPFLAAIGYDIYVRRRFWQALKEHEPQLWRKARQFHLIKYTFGHAGYDMVLSGMIQRSTASKELIQTADALRAALDRHNLLFIWATILLILISVAALGWEWLSSLV